MNFKDLKLKSKLIVFLMLCPYLLVAQAPPPSSTPPSTVGLPIDDHAWIVGAMALTFALWQNYKVEIIKKTKSLIRISKLSK